MPFHLNTQSMQEAFDAGKQASSRRDTQPLLTFTVTLTKSVTWDFLSYHWDVARVLNVHFQVQNLWATYRGTRERVVFAILTHTFVWENRKNIGFLQILVPKGVLNDVSSHFIDCAQRYKAFANIWTNFQNFRLPRGVSRGSYWGVILSKIVKKRHFSWFHRPLTNVIDV